MKQGHCLMFFFGLIFQLERLKRECKSKKTSAKQIKDSRFPVSEVQVTTTVTTKGKNAGPIKVKPGEKSRKNLQLLRDMQTIQTSLQKDDISWDYWLFCRGYSWHHPGQTSSHSGYKAAAFLAMWDYCMLSALLKYGPLILHPWVWLYTLWSSLKRIPFLRYPATESEHRSPGVMVPAAPPFSFSTRSTAHLRGLACVKCHWTVHWEASRRILLKTMLRPQVLRAFVGSVLCAAAITWTLRVSKGEQVNLLKVFCGALLKKLS